MTVRAPSSYPSLCAGLSLTLLATLLLEVVNNRLLSVLTWYHLSFLAISVAMLGAAAGAVIVFTVPRLFVPTRGLDDLPRWSTAFAIALPVSHVLNLVIPVPEMTGWRSMDLVALAAVVAILTVPFFLSGIVVTLALTRSGGAVNVLYGFDLVGAAVGTLVAVALLSVSNATSAVLAAAAFAWLAAGLFRVAAGHGHLRWHLVGAAAMVALALFNHSQEWLGVLYPKNRATWSVVPERSLWNSHSHILVLSRMFGPAPYWGPDVHAPGGQISYAWMLVDGEAGTPLVEWDGARDSLDWVSHDVTSLVHYLRRGDAAVIGVGGGRDVLAAIWGGSTRITAIEINGRIIDVLSGSHQNFTKIVGYPGVEVIHDEARSYLTRHASRFDVLQMSLVDTWAATGAGAFSLTENGLYTVEAWRLFLNRLKPGGVLSVSRWFAGAQPLETARLVALAVGALVDRGVERPIDHLVLVTRGSVATLLVSPDPFSADDLQRVSEVCRDHGLAILASRHTQPDGRLGDILASTSSEQLTASTADFRFDYTAPTDSRPFFFNMLRPQALLRGVEIEGTGVIAGNLRATITLTVLFGIAVSFVIAIILVPLAAAGRPAMPPVTFACALGYFAAIGAGFMFTQVAFLQRFSVYLGHPTYTFAGVLFLMIVFTGLGSFSSAWLDDARQRWFWLIPIVIVLWLTAAAVALPRLLDATVHLVLPGRLAVVASIASPLSFLLGFCFPFGARRIGNLDQSALAWMWGTNGAAGVVASVGAVMVSIWAGIEANLALAAMCYLSLIPFALVLVGRRFR